MLIMPLLFFLAFVLLTSLVYVLCLDNIESLQHLQHKNLTNSVISYWKTKHGNCKGFEVKVGLHRGVTAEPITVCGCDGGADARSQEGFAMGAVVCR